MTSQRLRKVYDSREWRRIRLRVMERDGFQCCRMVFITGMGWARCAVMDTRVGGSESLTVDHTSEVADPFDEQYLVTLCRHHHGKKDGARGAQRRRQW